MLIVGFWFWGYRRLPLLVHCGAARESTMFYVLHEDAWTMHLACVPQVFANTLVFLEVLNFFGTSNVHKFENANVVK